MNRNELFTKAMATAHEQCVASNGECIHEQAMRANRDVLKIALGAALDKAMEASVDPALFFFHMGVHVGYRFHQLEYLENPPGASS